MLSINESMDLNAEKQRMLLAMEDEDLNTAYDILKRHPKWVNKTTSSGVTLLMLAIKKHRTDLMMTLIRSGANLNCVTKIGDTALHYARMYNRGVCASLVNVGAIDSLQRITSGAYLIHEAAREGDKQLVTLLLRKQPELLEQLDNDGQTPLTWAQIPGFCAFYDGKNQERAEVAAYLHSQIEAKLNGKKAMPHDSLLSHEAYTQQGPLFFSASKTMAPQRLAYRPAEFEWRNQW